LVPVALAALALGALAFENAAVLSFSDSDPGTAATLWPSHPAAAIGLSTREIALASGSGRSIDQQSFERLQRATKSAPIEPQPFVVAGIRAQLAGRDEDARRAFEAARLRDPRSLPARYFLAAHHLQKGDAAGLRDVAALARLAPGGTEAIAPYLAAFARQERAWPAIRAVFADNPRIRDSVLSALANDPANLRPVLALGGTYDPAKAPWLRTMIGALVAKQQYAQAHRLWQRTAGIAQERGEPGLFDPGFRNDHALPPFNWELTSSSVGLAERRSGRLHVIFYGQASGALARQLLLLPPGRYRIAAPASGGGSADLLFWQVRCASAPSTEFGRAPAKGGRLPFAVPANCPAQWLELNGRASDFGSETELTIGPLTLSRVGAP
jgi:hypothetical protein